MAVVFDMDGVLVDTEHLWDEVREELTTEWGGRYTPEAQEAMMGMSSPEWSRYLHETVGLREQPETINAEVVRRMLARYEVELPVVPGAVEAVRRLHGEGLPPRCRVVLEPRADRRRAPTTRRHRPVRRDRLVRGGRARQAGAGRVPRDRAHGSTSSRRGVPRSRTRRAGSAPLTPPACTCSRTRTGTTRRRPRCSRIADVVLESLSGLEAAVGSVEPAVDRLHRTAAEESADT